MIIVNLWGVKAEWNPNKPAFFVGLKEESTEESSKLLQNQPEYKCMLTFDLNSGKVIDKKII